MPDSQAPRNDQNDERPNGIATMEANVAEPTGAVVRRAGTFESFRYRSFTLFWFGALISNTGTWMQTAALAIVVWGLRSRELDLGLVNFAAGIPVLFLALPAGLIADRVDKRKLLIWGQALLAIQATALWALYRSGRLVPTHALEALAWIVGLGLAAGVVSALTFPAWQAFMPDLVPRERLMNAIALNSAQFQSSRLLGPLAASGILIVGASTGDIFMVNAGSFLFVIAALWAIKPLSDGSATDAPPMRHASNEGPWHTLTAGLRYAREDRAVGLLILSTAIMTVFAMPYMMLLPAIADRVLHGANHGSLYYSWLMAANGFGAIFGSLAVASLPPHARRDRILPFAIVSMALLLIGFSLSRTFLLSMVLSVCAGAAFLTINSLSNTTIQATVPGHLRGRVMALFVMSFMGIMPVSSVAFGPLGEWIGPANAVLAGAVVVLVWGIVLAASGWLTPGKQTASPNC